ncbi:hypothetical protein EV714DRAFT_218547 [Schizophyllum commune]
MAHIEVVEDDAPVDDYGAVLEEVPIHNAQLTHESRRKRRVRPVPSRWKRAGLWSLFCLVFWLAYTMRKHLDRPSQDVHAKRWGVKVAILLALMDMLEPIPTFFFQLQPAFVNLADDPSNVAASYTGRLYQPAILGPSQLSPLPQRPPQSTRVPLSQPAYHYPNPRTTIPARVPLPQPASEIPARIPESTQASHAHVVPNIIYQTFLQVPVRVSAFLAQSPSALAQSPAVTRVVPAWRVFVPA